MKAIPLWMTTAVLATIATLGITQTSTPPEVSDQVFYYGYTVDEPRAPRYDGPGTNMEILTDVRAIVVSRFQFRSAEVTNWIYNTNRIPRPVDLKVKYFRATSTPAGTVWVESDGVGIEFLTLPSQLSPR